MSEESKLNTIKKEVDSINPIEVIENTFSEFLDAACVDAVYGPAIKEGETLIIPTAEVLAVMGFGVGSGYGKGKLPVSEMENLESQENEAESEGGGGGGGGGGRVLSRPVAVVIVSSEGVRVEPVVDVTKIGLAALTAAGFVLGMMLRMLNPRKGL